MLWLGVCVVVGLRLVERDYTILNEIVRWRFCLGRQIRILSGFEGQRACDRRLAKLIEAGYLKREYFIYGIPGLYIVSQKAKEIFNLQYYTPKIRIEQIQHDIAVIDTAIYLIHRGIDSKSIITERDLKHRAGFGNPKHYPDFIYQLDNKTYCVEVELSVKKQNTLEKNIKDNYINYDVQKWFVPNNKVKISEYIKTAEKRYSNIEIIPLEAVEQYVKAL